jgi:hypothetical protein
MSDGKDEGKGQTPASRADMDDALRFVHTMEMQTKAMLRDTAMKVTAMIQELIATGVVDRDKLMERFTALKPTAEAADKEMYHVRIGNDVNKYELTDLPQIDCASLIPLCKARCCTLAVFLSFQDLDEKVLIWDYTAPYLLKRGPDNYCVHIDKQGHFGCTVYDKRPAACRGYDCRKDKRIWLDFEKRIPAPIEASAPSPPSNPPSNPGSP